MSDERQGFLLFHQNHFSDNQRDFLENPPPLDLEFFYNIFIIFYSNFNFFILYYLFRIPTDSEAHPLSSSFTLTFVHRPPGKAGMTTEYNDNIKAVATFSTVEEFWSLYSHCKRPNDLPSVTEYHLFRDNIKPIWEVIWELLFCLSSRIF